MITTERITTASGTALAEINALLPQLRRDPAESPGSQVDLDLILSDKNTLFVVSKDGEKIIGMATVYLVTKFGKRTGFVEDVIVDDGYRGKGLGQKIMEVLIAEAKKSGATQLYLTSGNDRTAAQALYQKLGFKKRDTQVFKLEL